MKHSLHLLTLLMAPVAGAQDLFLDELRGCSSADFESWAAPVDGEWWSFAGAEGVSYSNAAIEGRPGSVSVDRYGLGLGLQREYSGKGVLGLDLDHSRQTYNPNWNLGGIQQPLAEADHYRLQAAWYDRRSESLTWYASARAEAGAEARVDGAGALGEPAFGATAGFELQVGEDLGLELSFDAQERLDDDLRLTPLALVDWRVREDLHLGRVAGGYGLDYNHDLETRFFVSVDRDERQFRLGSEAGGDGVVVDEETSLRAGMIWQPEPDLCLELYAGKAGRQLTLLDEGTKVDAFQVEDTPFVGFRLSFGPGAIF
ncbi:MAG: hypothetical protein P1V81_02130 [Planctomycetota bacterium]|nr:hypothetical protein [Planctomycetota bacterium]